jgi:hypothetical protein
MLGDTKAGASFSTMILCSTAPSFSVKRGE